MMEELLFFFEVLLGGLLTGIMYSLVALGLVLIFKASQIFNFAQGALVLFAALTFVLMLEVGPGFWSWTGWLAVAFALLAAGIWGLRRYTTVLDAPKRYGRTPVVIAALAVVLLPIVLDGGQPMWRAIFIVELAFLMLTVGARTPNWAAGVLLGLAAACFFLDGAILWRALAVTLLVMIMTAIAIERIVLRPLVNQEPIILFMAAIGLNFVIEGVAQGVWDANVHALDIGIPDVPIAWLRESLGLFVSIFDVVAAVTAGALVAALAWFFNRTRVGRGLRAVADDHQAALSVGIPLKNIWAVVWSASAIVALFAGLMWGSKLGVQFSIALLAFKALPVILIGGFTSIPGAIVGGLIVGATEKLFEIYVGIPFFGGGTENWSPYMLGTLFLLLRPQGLFGEKIIERV